MAPQSTQPKKPQRAGQTPRTSRPHNPRSLREGGGPDAQDQSSFQHKKPQGGRRARRPGPVVHPTKEPQGQSPLGELRSARCTTSTPQHNHKSVTGLGQVSMLWSVSAGRVGGGGRPVTTVKHGSLRTQAVTRNRGGSSRDRIP